MSKYLRPQTLFGNKFESYLMDAEKHDVRNTKVLFADVKTTIEEPELTDEEWLRMMESSDVL
jgi:hypothetical protein